MHYFVLEHIIIGKVSHFERMKWDLTVSSIKTVRRVAMGQSIKQASNSKFLQEHVFKYTYKTYLIMYFHRVETYMWKAVSMQEGDRLVCIFSTASEAFLMLQFK